MNIISQYITHPWNTICEDFQKKLHTVFSREEGCKLKGLLFSRYLTFNKFG